MVLQTLFVQQNERFVGKRLARLPFIDLIVLPHLHRLAAARTGIAVAGNDDAILSLQAKLSQESQQADNAITRKKGCTDLGLAISKRVIEMPAVEVGLSCSSAKIRRLPSHSVVVERQVKLESK